LAISTTWLYVRSSSYSAGFHSNPPFSFATTVSGGGILPETSAREGVNR